MRCKAVVPSDTSPQVLWVVAQVKFSIRQEQKSRIEYLKNTDYGKQFLMLMTEVASVVVDQETIPHSGNSTKDCPPLAAQQMMQQVFGTATEYEAKFIAHCTTVFICRWQGQRQHNGHAGGSAAAGCISISVNQDGRQRSSQQEAQQDG